MSAAEKYRKNVCVIVTNGEGGVLLCKRSDQKYDNTWQAVQGGIDEGESTVNAAIRETHEELGIAPHDIRVLDVMDKAYAYRWDDEYIAKFASGFVGQEQVFVLVEIPHDVSMNLDAHQREFCDVMWGSPEELLQKSWIRKQPGVRAALIHFGLLVDRS